MLGTYYLSKIFISIFLYSELETMVFHRLRVISFSKPLLSPKVSNKKERDVQVQNKVISSKKAHSKKDTTEYRTGYKQNSSSSIVPLPLRPCLQYKSKSEIFGTPSQTLKNHTTGKTLSLNNLKRQLSLIDSVSFNQIKQKLQLLRQEKPVKNIKKHDIKVLYVAESRSRNRRRSNKHHREHDIPKPSDNIFSFYRSKRLSNLHTNSQNYNKSGSPFHKFKTRSVRRRKQFHDACTDYTHHPLKVVTSGKIRVSQSYIGGGGSDPLHCNILRFPHTTKQKPCQNNSSLKLYRSRALPKDNIGCDHSLETKKMHKVSRGQIVPTSNLEALVVCVDKAVSTCKSVKLLNSSKSNANPEFKPSNERRQCNHSTRKLPIKKIYLKIYNKILARTHHPKQRLSARAMAKHILVSLVVLAWSPCIFAMGICWVISYPLRHQHVASGYHRKTCRRKDDRDATQYQYDWWSTFTNHAKRITNEIKKALSTLLLLKGKSKLKVLPHRSHPDPCRRYTLFHAKDRGWVIKPVRVQDPKKNRLIQTFQNLFCVCKPSYHPSISQRKYIVKHRASSHAPCRKTFDRKPVTRKHLDSKHEDCICLEPSKSTVTPNKTCDKINKTVNKTCKNETCKKLNAKRDDIACTTPAKPPAIPNKEGFSKPCLLRDAFNLSCKCKHCLAEPGISGFKTSELDFKHGDCTCLDQSNSTAKQKPDLTCKSCAKSNQSGNKTCKTFNITPVKPPAIPNKEGLSKPCLLRDNFDLSCKPCLNKPGMKTVSENVVQAPKSGERFLTHVCKCQTKAEKQPDANHTNKIKSTQSKPPNTTCRSCSIASKEIVSEKLLDTKREDKDSSSLSKQCPKKIINIEHRPCKNSTCSGLLKIKRSRSVKDRPCNNSTCSGLLETKRSRSATRRRCPVRDLVLQRPVPRRSVSKKYASFTRRSILKPDHDVVIVEPGSVIGSGDPPKITTKYTKQIGPNKPDAKNTKASSAESGPNKSDAKNRKTSSPKSDPKKSDAKSKKASSPESGLKKSDAKSKKASSPESGPKKSDVKTKKVSNPQKVTSVAPVPPQHESKTVSEPTLINKEKHQKDKSLKTKLSVGQRFMAWARSWSRNTAESVNSFDKELQSIFSSDVRCGDLYMYTLRSRPCYWIYKAKPSLYPCFLRFYYCSRSCCSHCLFIISLCFCAPIAFCCYVCYQLCLSCCGCC